MHTHLAYSAARWTAVSSLINSGLRLLQVAVLARFLLPSDYGLMAMVTVVLSYASLFSDMGLSTAFIQRQRISQKERSSLYWLSVAVGATLMFLVMAITPMMAIFFKEPQLAPLMFLIATNFLVIALGQQLRIDAEKSLNFRPIAIIEIIAALTAFGIAVFFAWHGWGVYALVFSSMCNVWLTMILSWLMLAQGWRPAWRLRWNEVRYFARFGSGMVLNNVINHANTTIDLLLGGRVLGASGLGLYSVPRNLILQVQFMINPIFTRLGFPLIASLQNDKEQIKGVYLKLMNMTASVNAPIYVALAVFSPEIVLLLLGPTWVNAAPLMGVLAVWGLLRSFINPVGSLLFGLGHIRRSILWNLGSLFISAPIIWLGSSWGEQGMAWAMAGLMVMLLVAGWAILIKPSCDAAFLEYFKQVMLPTLCAVAAGYLASILANLLTGAIVRLIFGLIVGIIGYFIFSFFVNRKWLLSIFRALNTKSSSLPR